jgi:hypothetical protein
VTSPTGDEVHASIGALHADAGVWSGMATRLDSFGQAARGLSLSSYEFSGLGHLAGLDQIYTALQERVVSLLDQGSRNFDGIASALHAAADDYDRDERDAVHRLKSVY